MKRLAAFFVFFGICAAISFSQENDVQSQKKMMVRRAAILDAYRQLVESIKVFKISSKSLVKDFILQNDSIESKLGECTLRSAQVVATRYMPDGSCEVDMVLNLNDLIAFLKTTQSEYSFPLFRETNFDEVAQQSLSKYIRATGKGILLESMSTAQLQNLQNESSILKEEIIRLKKQLADLQTFQQNFLGFLEENKELKKQIQTLEDKGTSYTKKDVEEWSSYKQKYQESLKEIENLKKDIQRSQNMLLIYQGYQEQAQKSFAENRELKEQIAQSKAKCQEQQTQVDSYAEYKIKHEEMLKKYQQALEEIEAAQKQILEVNDLKTKIGQITQENNRLKKEQKDLKNKLSSQDQSLRELENLKKQKEHFIKEKGKLVSQMEQDQNSMVQLQIQNAQLQAEIELLKRVPVGVWVDANPEQKIMARKAAINDAYRQIMESLKNIRVDTKAAIKDLLVENDPVHVALEGFIQDAKIIDTRYLADGTCEVDMMVALHDFIKFFKDVSKNQNLEQIQIYNPAKYIKVTGCGTFK
ncbi:MAG: hypothetical protein HUU50_01240 [Candidatus Brocadiae bacterium]|nr:hypothetical protein [Candidatus Brocadiia bacterium]